LIRTLRLANWHDQRSNKLFPDAVAAPIAEEKARDSFVPGLIVQGKGGEKNTLNVVLLSPGPENVRLMQIKTMETCHPRAQDGHVGMTGLVLDRVTYRGGNRLQGGKQLLPLQDGAFNPAASRLNCYPIYNPSKAVPRKFG
jgi:hypothetical protein